MNAGSYGTQYEVQTITNANLILKQNILISPMYPLERVNSRPGYRVHSTIAVT